MNDDLSKKTFCVFDHYGLFLGLAERLSKSGAHVLYQTPVDRYDRINEAIIGEGIEGIEVVEEFWPYKKQIDCFVFPDIRHSGLQAELRAQGFPVWGSQSGMDLEQKREFFLKKIGELGLAVAPHKVVVGLTNLKVFLKDKKDIWIKVSMWRGTWETFHWRSWNEDAHQFANWECKKWGGLSELIRFICFDKIDTKIEIGADTYCVDGKWPSQMLHGIEKKDAAYLSTVTPYDKMPDEIRPILEALSPYMKEVGYRNQWSMEVRVAEKESFFIDATCRGGLPSTRSFLESKNVAEVIYHGAHGEFVEVDYGFKFSAECMVITKADSEESIPVVLPDEVRESFMLQQCYDVNGKLWYPPLFSGGHYLGWLCTIGDTPKETLEKMNVLADALPDGLDAQVEDLADAIREVDEMRKAGIWFTDETIPKADIVLEPSKKIKVTPHQNVCQT